MENLNHGVSASPPPSETPKTLQWVNTQMLLCRKCNNNQSSKIKQLASFIPRDDVRKLWLSAATTLSTRCHCCSFTRSPTITRSPASPVHHRHPFPTVTRSPPSPVHHHHLFTHSPPSPVHHHLFTHSPPSPVLMEAPSSVYGSLTRRRDVWRHLV